MNLTLPSGTPAFLTDPDEPPAPNGGPRRGLVIVPDLWGLRPLFTDMAAGLAERTGWRVAVLDPFGTQDLPGEPDGFAERSAAVALLDDDRLLGDAADAADATGADGVGLIGFCMGGMYALKAAGTGRFDRIVSFYGMIRVPPQWKGEGHGEPLDALALRGETEVMSVVGTIDEWTPADDVDALEDAGVTVARYEGADHGFVHDPSRPTHRAQDAADAWDRALAFLDGGS